MILRGIAKRYAVALFNAAVAQDVAEQVDGDLTSFDRLLKHNTAFHNFLWSPQVLTEDKKDLIVQIVGERSSGLFVTFLMLLIDKKRLEHVGEIAEVFNYLFEQLQGIVEVRIITAVPIERELEIKTVLRLEEKTGKQIRLVKSVDESIIGGMIVIIEGKIIDGSIRHQLDSMKTSLTELRVH